MSKFKEYMECVRYLHKHRDEPENRQKRRRRLRDKHVSRGYMERMLDALRGKQ